MALVPMPESIIRPIAYRATALSQTRVQGYGWRSSGALHPVSAEGTIGVRTTAQYLIFQSRGTRPRVMWELEGKVIPMPGPGGIQFRYAKGVGQPGWVSLPGGVQPRSYGFYATRRGPDGGLQVYRQQKWRHPGLRPRRFLEDSIDQAIREARPNIQTHLMRVLTGDES